MSFVEFENNSDLLTMKEGSNFDRKASDYELGKLANTLIGFANADGGTVAFGIKNKKFQGISNLSPRKQNEVIQVGQQILPTINVKSEYIDVINCHNNPDQIILLSVSPAEDKLYSNRRDEVFLRQGDINHKVTFDERQSLEDDKNIRKFESRVVEEAVLQDLDKNLIEQYADLVDFDLKNKNIWDLLFSKGFAKRTFTDDQHINFVYRLTHAGILVFGKEPTAFLPNARIRFIRYEGREKKTGADMNIIKQVDITGPLPNMLKQVQDTIKSQLRNFMALDSSTGKFNEVPEYPNDAWLEGVVNAVAHRSYNFTGDDIRILMFDDRLEIHSPGGFPRFVTKNNIRHAHYSRNPYIAQGLAVFGWVREFGEGVDRIYTEMDKFFLDKPEYEDTLTYVKLTLKNNILARSFRKNSKLEIQYKNYWDDLNSYEKTILSLVYEKKHIKTADAKERLGVSAPVARKTLNNLTDMGLLEKIASSPTAPNQFYKIKD